MPCGVNRREPIIARGGLMRLTAFIILVIAGRSFAAWLDPIVASAFGRDINAPQSYLAEPVKTQDRVPALARVP